MTFYLLTSFLLLSEDMTANRSNWRKWILIILDDDTFYFPVETEKMLVLPWPFGIEYFVLSRSMEFNSSKEKGQGLMGIRIKGDVGNGDLNF